MMNETVGDRPVGKWTGVKVRKDLIIGVNPDTKPWQFLGLLFIDFYINNWFKGQVFNNL
jgi:hypothetical protein